MDFCWQVENEEDFALAVVQRSVMFGKKFSYNKHVLLLQAGKPIKIKKENPKAFDFIFSKMA